MAQLLVLVVDQVEFVPEVLAAWREIGIPGVTILDSLGSQRQADSERDDLPLMPSLRNILGGHETHNRTLFSVIEDEAVLEKAAQAALRILGDLEQPNNGIMFTVPVGQAWGHTRLRALAPSTPKK